jgi:hypothetical protein
MKMLRMLHPLKFLLRIFVCGGMTDSRAFIFHFHTHVLLQYRDAGISGWYILRCCSHIVLSNYVLNLLSVLHSYGCQNLKAIYEGPNVVKDLRRSMNPGAARDVGCWRHWVQQSDLQVYSSVVSHFAIAFELRCIARLCHKKAPSAQLPWASFSKQTLMLRFCCRTLLSEKALILVRACSQAISARDMFIRPLIANQAHSIQVLKPLGLCLVFCLSGHSTPPDLSLPPIFGSQKLHNHTLSHLFYPCINIRIRN